MDSDVCFDTILFCTLCPFFGGDRDFVTVKMRLVVRRGQALM